MTPTVPHARAWGYVCWLCIAINVRGTANARVLGSKQMDAFQGHHHRIDADYGAVSFSATGQVLRNASSGSLSVPRATTVVSDGVSGNSRISAETRGLNVALHPVITL